MKHNGFEIKIADLLKTKATDTLSFENKMLPELPNLTAEGVSWTVVLQSLDQDSLLVTLENVEGKLEEICDHCGVSFIRPIAIEAYRGKYVSQLDPEGKDKEEEILLIDLKNGVIDLEEMLYHAIQLEEPFVKRCPACEALPLEEEEAEFF